MELTEQKLYDYIYCPLKYDIKYNKKINLTEQIKMNNLLKSVSKYFFINLMNEKVLPINVIKSKWDNICNKHKEIIDSNKAIKGLSLLYKLYEWSEKNRIYVIDVDAKYEYKVNNTLLIGTIDIILKSNDNTNNIIYIDFGNRIKNSIDIDMNLKMTIDTFGFLSSYNKKAVISYYNVKNDKIITTFRTNNDIKRLDSTINNISKAIKENIYYPRESVFCQNCNAKQYCRYWH